MDQKTLRKVQLVQLEIAKEIRRVCQENDIKCFLDGGTLLGAVRHQGFIPWDDDLDMGMQREDYERFLKIAPQKLSPQYCLVTWYNEKNYGHAFAKVCKKNTVYIEQKAKKQCRENGIYVDIFPYDVYQEKDGFRQQGIWLNLLHKLIWAKCGYVTWNENGRINWKKYISYIPFRIAACFISKKAMIKKYDVLAVKYNQTNGKFLQEQDCFNYGKSVVPREILNSLVDLKFEDTTFPCAAGYDTYLKALYGNYMKLPPAEERENRHQIIEVRF